MTKILFTVFSPFASRQVFNRRFLEAILAQTNLELVYLVPKHKEEFYRSLVADQPRIQICGVAPWPRVLNWLDRVFFSLSLHYLENESVKILRRTWRKDRGLSYGLVSWPLFQIFRWLPPARRLARWLDFVLVRHRQAAQLLGEHCPHLVVATHAIYAPEQAFIREAKRLGINTLSVVNSWDNLSVYKGVIRVLPDRLVVPNEIVKSEAIKWCDLSPQRIWVIGMWNCDYYFHHQPLPRSDFCRHLGLQSDKPYVLFAAIGRNYTDTEWQDLEIIQTAIKDGLLPADLQVVVRQHPDPSSTMELGALEKQPNLVFQAASQILGDSSSGAQNYEITSTNDFEAFNTLYHAAVVVTIQSTISIEASLFDRPVVNINFDGWEKRPFYHPRGIRRYHHLTHYLPVHQSGGVRLVNSPEELVTALGDYLADPTLDRGGRRRLVEQLVGPLDGRALERLSQIILSGI